MAVTVRHDAVSGVPRVRSARAPQPGWPVLPRRWLDVILPAELPKIARDIVAEVRAGIPEYRRAMNGPYGRSTRASAENALVAFVNQIVAGKAFTVAHEDYFRELGRTEAREGRQHEVLLTAYRIGSLAAWKRLTAINEREPLPPDTVAALATALFTFIDQLAEWSTQGYREVQRERSDQGDRLRSRLVQMVLDQPATPMDAIVELADQIGWPLPDRLIVIDLRYDHDTSIDVCALFGPRALVGVGSPPPTVIIPEADAAGLRERLAAAPRSVRVTIGGSVPVVHARQSLQWAQLAARMRSDGAIDDTPVIDCADHLPALLLHANPLATHLLVSCRLAPLLTLSAPKRVKYARLLSAWLELGGSQADVADALGMHRQTAHYQFGRVAELFGDELRERDSRVEMLLALRAVLPEWERSLNDQA